MGDDSWSRWFRATRAPGDRLIVCFPHAGGASSAFRSWSVLQRAGDAVLPVKLPGREERLREPAATRSEQVIPHIASALVSKADGPVVVFGHSMGALLALDLCETLEYDHGVDVERLVVSGSQPPHLLPRYGLPDLPAEDLLDSLDQMGSETELLRREPSLFALVERALRADLTLCETYVWGGRPVSCQLTAVGGVRDPRVHVESLTAWGRYTSGPTSVLTVEAGHFYLDSHAREVFDAVLGLKDRVA